MNGHKHSGKSHLIGMVAIGVVILGGLLVAGRSIGEALPVAAALACPVMMIGMVFMMMRSGKNKNNDAAHDSPMNSNSATTGAEKAPTKA